MKIVHLLLLGMASLVACQQQTSTPDPNEEEAEVYDFTKLNIGLNPDAAFNDYGIIFNQFDFEKEMEDTDKLTFVYLIDTQRLQGGANEMIHKDIVAPVAKEMKGYFRFFLFDCAHPDFSDEAIYKKFSGCDPEKNPAAMPVFNLFVPPTMKKNPYTGEAMQRQLIAYPQNAQISKPLFKKWITGYLPDYTLKIESRKQFDQLTRVEDDINKVMLFTKKNVVAPVLKAVSAEYSNRLRFYVVPISDTASQDLLDLKQEFNVTDMPTLLVQQTYDVEFDKINQDRTLIPFGSKTYKYQDLAGFFQKYARPTPKDESVEAAQQKVEQEAEAKQGSDKLPPFEEVTPSDFKKSILENDQAHLVYFTAQAVDADIADEFKYIKKLSREIRGPIKLSVCRLDKSKGDYETLKSSVRQLLTNIQPGKPQLHFYPNKFQDANKVQKSVEILFDKEDAKFAQIYEEIHDNFQHNIDQDVSAYTFNAVLVQKAQKEKRNVVYFMYAGDEHITLAFKHLSLHPIFNTNDDTHFMALKDPPMDQFKGLSKEMLPTIGVIPKLDDEFTEGQISQETLNGRIHYDALLDHVIKITGKQDEAYRLEKNQQLAKTKRNFGEIASQKDFKERCTDFKKGCAIAMLPAMTMQDYEKTNFEQHVAALSELDEQAKTMPIFYSWVNITCHPEFLQFFEIDAFQVPTVVYYYPEKHVQGNLIGMFAKDAIHSHEQRFLKGKLATWSPKKALADLVIDDSIDCSKPPQEATSEEDEELYAEIMREMQEEEEAKRLELEKIERELEEQEKKNKKAKKSSGKKGKKKKAKKGGSSKKEDL